MTSLWHGRATQRADEGMCNWLYQFRAWVLLAEFLLSDDGNLGRKTLQEISLEIFFLLTTIAASGTSQIRGYINVSTSL